MSVEKNRALGEKSGTMAEIIYAGGESRKTGRGDGHGGYLARGFYVKLDERNTLGPFNTKGKALSGVLDEITRLRGTLLLIEHLTRNSGGFDAARMAAVQALRMDEWR